MPPGDLIFTIKPTDFSFSGESTITYQERNPSGDWEEFRPTDEWQRRYSKGVLGYDTFSCVTFSALRIVAMQLEYMLRTSPSSAQILKPWLEANGYIDAAGKINFNEWFTANMSGTTDQGNTAQNVWDSIRRDGILPQGAGPQVNDFKTRDEWLDETKITQAQKDQAKKILDVIRVDYEWAIMAPAGGAWDEFRKQLKHAPLHIFTPVSPDWNRKDGLPVMPDGTTKLVHATSNVKIDSVNNYRDLDHYEPFLKVLDHNYYIPYAIKAVVSLKGAPIAPQAPAHVFNINLAYGAPASLEVHALQEALQFLGLMKEGVFGPYGPATRAAVAKLQIEAGIPDLPQGEHFGPMTRKYLNAKLSG